MTYVVSTLVLLLLGTGLYFRKRSTPLHRGLMIAAFVVDLGLLTYVELSRHAVETAISSTSPLVWFHAAVSTGVLICYVAMMGLGPALRRGRRTLLGAHRGIGWTLFALRSLNYVTAFMV